MGAAKPQFVYVLGDDSPTINVGITIDPKQRLRAVSRATGRNLKIRHLLCIEAGSDVVEAISHWLLKEHHVEGEWFNIDEDSAFDAVIEALHRYGFGETAPERVGGPGRFKRWHENMIARFAEGTFARIESVLSADEDRTDFVRESVRREIERRLIQSGEDARTFPASTGDADP